MPVMSTQHVLPETAAIAFAYRDTVAHVDALATALYFGTTRGGTSKTRDSSPTVLSANLPVSTEQAIDNRRVTVRHNKRYIAYEGGQGLVLPAHVRLLE